MKVAIIMGSTSDLPKMEACVDILKNYGVEVNVRCLSAHRAHAGLSAFIEETAHDGTEVIITAAGMAAALPGVVASQTVLPVIGVPLSGATLDGMDALLSIVQMPSGIPVATVAINGGKNAAYLAMQIMAIKHDELKDKLSGLMDEITEQGKKISTHMDIKDMKKYRSLVKSFMNEVVTHSHEFSRENFLDRRGRHRVYGIVRAVDKNLDELAEELMKDEKDQIAVLDKVGEIQGMLLDISI